MKNLEECRKEINEIDGKLVELLRQRMHISIDVATYKKANGLPIYDAERERALLHRVEMLAGEGSREAILAVFEVILMQSKKKQMEIVG